MNSKISDPALDNSQNLNRDIKIYDVAKDEPINFIMGETKSLTDYNSELSKQFAGKGERSRDFTKRNFLKKKKKRDYKKFEQAWCKSKQQ